MADALSVRAIRKLSAFTLDAALDIPAGPPSITILFGPSGSGKSTLLRSLAGLETPDSGRIVFGADTWYDSGKGISIAPQARRVGMLFQDYALFPHLSVVDNILFGLNGTGAGRAAELMDLFGIRDIAGQRPGSLSDGQKQRVALARAVAPGPRLLLLDEPLSALDDPTRVRLRSELRAFLVRLGIPAIVVTHDRTEAIALGDRMAVMIGGRIVQWGPVEEVFGSPANLDVALSVGVETVLPCSIVETLDGMHRVRSGPVELRVAEREPLPGPDAFLCIRAEEVLLEPAIAGQSSARNHLTGTISAIEPEGALVRVRIDCGVPLMAMLTRQAATELNLSPAMPIVCVVKATAIHLIPHLRTMMQ